MRLFHFALLGGGGNLKYCFTFEMTLLGAKKRRWGAGGGVEVVSKKYSCELFVFVQAFNLLVTALFPQSGRTAVRSARLPSRVSTLQLLREVLFVKKRPLHFSSVSLLLSSSVF